MPTLVGLALWLAASAAGAADLAPMPEARIRVVRPAASCIGCPALRLPHGSLRGSHRPNLPYGGLGGASAPRLPYGGLRPPAAPDLPYGGLHDDGPPLRRIRSGVISSKG